LICSALHPIKDDLNDGSIEGEVGSRNPARDSFLAEERRRSVGYPSSWTECSYAVTKMRESV
jgi:hypothetical protein